MIGPKETTKIVMYMHCGTCLRQKPAGVSPRDWQQLEVGWTKAEGIQVWCKRCEMPVITIEEKQ